MTHRPANIRLAPSSQVKTPRYSQSLIRHLGLTFLCIAVCLSLPFIGLLRNGWPGWVHPAADLHTAKVYPHPGELAVLEGTAYTKACDHRASSTGGTMSTNITPDRIARKRCFLLAKAETCFRRKVIRSSIHLWHLSHWLGLHIVKCALVSALRIKSSVSHSQRPNEFWHFSASAKGRQPVYVKF